MPRPIHATIFPAAIAHNLAIARHLSPAPCVWAVVKANAYGHGIERVYLGLAQADGLAMLDVAEAQRVRQLGWQKPILMLEGGFDASDLTLASGLNLDLIVHSTAQLALLAAHPTPLNLHIKLNTGMNRLGLPSNDHAHWASALAAMPQHRIVAWVTHFADADVEGGERGAMQIFEAALKAVFEVHPQLRAPLSVSNSAAICRGVSPGNLPIVSTRTGIMLYGSSPFAPSATRSAAALGLRPTMQLRSQIIALQALQAGDVVGYGSTFTAAQSMRIGIVACGYADGYPRHAPTGTPIAVDGEVTRTVGRVSMDMLAVDLSLPGLEQAGIGSEVELWGGQISIDAVAASAGTIGYELMCALALRVPVSVKSLLGAGGFDA